MLEQATDFDPNFAHAWARSGSIKAILGDYDAALERASRALRLSPRDPHHHVTQSVLGHVYFFKREYRKAIECADDVLRAQPGDLGMLPVRVSSYALPGNTEAARGALSDLLDSYPAMSITRALELSPHRNSSYREQLAAGLRIAGLPE